MSALEQLRGDIDAIDRQIVDLMKQRMETVYPGNLLIRLTAKQRPV